MSPTQKRVAILAAFLYCVLLTGCQNGYTQFYQGTRETKTDQARVVRATDLSSSAVQIGSSSFTGPFASEGLAVAAAKSVGANVLTLQIDYVGSSTSIASIPQYNAGQYQTTNTNFNGSATVNQWGRSPQQINYSGQARSSGFTPGYTTYSQVPITTMVYSHTAVFYRDPQYPGCSAPADGKPAPPSFGLSKVAEKSEVEAIAAQGAADAAKLKAPGSKP